MTFNQLTTMILDNSLMEEETKVPMIPEIPKEKVTSDKVSYDGVYVILNFNKEDGVERREEQLDVEQNPDEEDTEDVKLDDERKRQYRMVLE